MNAEQVRHARALLAQPDNTITSIAKLLGVSPRRDRRSLEPRTPSQSQPPARSGAGRRLTGGAIGAGAAVTALTMVGAPWWAVVVEVAVGITVSGLLALLQALVPGESHPAVVVTAGIDPYLEPTF